MWLTNNHAEQFLAKMTRRMHHADLQTSTELTNKNAGQDNMTYAEQ
jgi:hypothetical protein